MGRPKDSTNKSKECLNNIEVENPTPIIVNVEDRTGYMTPKLGSAQINYNVTATINTGNYESVKVSVGITYPSELGNIDATYKFIKDWVGTKMEKEVNEIRGIKNGEDENVSIDSVIPQVKSDNNWLEGLTED